ncbi:MAG TPA: glucosamine-6-phosphate deaminase [Planktothrix sp.]|jgi:glucosamine-6-phosphate deaminase
MQSRAAPVTKTDTYEALSHEMGEAIVKQLREKPDSCFGLPTGRTPLGCYKLLSNWSLMGTLDWTHARCFQLDEYVDPADETMTFEYFLDINLFKNTNLSRENRFSPRHLENYDEVIAGCGGLDLTILGIGTNGHIAFNEPGTIKSSWTHSLWLTESTRQANQSYFGGQPRVPRKAITMGIETILASKKLILIASGDRKREILERAMLGPVTPDVPASFLSLHPHVTVITDFDF